MLVPNSGGAIGQREAPRTLRPSTIRAAIGAAAFCCAALLSSASHGDLPGEPARVSSNPQPRRPARLYPLKIDPSVDAVESFAYAGTAKPYVILYTGQPNGIVFYDVVGNTPVKRASLLFSQLNTPGVMGETTEELENDGIELSDELTVSVPIAKNDLEQQYFSGSCLPPLSNFIRYTHGGETDDLVLLYVFDQPRRRLESADNSCYGELSAGSNGASRLINPVLVPSRTVDGSTFLAGRSYVSMPVVIRIDHASEILDVGGRLHLVDLQTALRAMRHAEVRFDASGTTRYRSVGRLVDAIEHALASLVQPARR